MNGEGEGNLVSEDKYNELARGNIKEIFRPSTYANCALVLSNAWTVQLFRECVTILIETES